MAWAVAQTAVRSERTARDALKREGFVPYLPRFVERGVERILFPQYVFVKLTQAWRRVRNVHGIVRLLTFAGSDRPKSIPHDFVRGLKKQEDGFGRIRLVKQLEKGEKVKLLNGQFRGHEALFMEYSAERRVWVMLSLLGGEVPLELAERYVVRLT